MILIRREWMWTANDFSPGIAFSA